MDEDEYKIICASLSPVPCVFEKSILALKTQCGKSAKKHLAEREIVMCTSAQHAAHCADWLALLRKKAQFSLHLSEYLSVLPHGKEMKVQVGGVLALHKMYAHAEELDGQPDVYGTLERCLRQTTSFESVPFDVVMREVMRFRLRK